MPDYSTSLEDAIHRAMDHAEARRQDLATLEHLALALIDDPDAAALMQTCGVDRDRLREDLTGFVDRDLSAALTRRARIETTPTENFKRVVDLAQMDEDHPDRLVMDGRDVLAAIVAEPDSHAAFLLDEAGLRRDDLADAFAAGLAAEADAVGSAPAQGHPAQTGAEDSEAGAPPPPEPDALLEQHIERELSDILKRAFDAPPEPQSEAK